MPAPVVRLSLAQGAIDLELDPVAAPVTVDNFLGYLQTGYYDNTLIHRVVQGFVIQGGGYTPGTPLPVAKPPTGGRGVAPSADFRQSCAQRAQRPHSAVTPSEWRRSRKVRAP